MRNIGSSGRLSMEQENEDGNENENNKYTEEEEEVSRMAIFSTFQAKEEEIERKKMDVKEKVELQLGRVEEETRRLVHIWEEIRVMGDPMKKEVAMLRKKIDMANREAKALAQISQKKEKEYREALEAFNEKNKEKSVLVTTLKELLAKSESFRMKKLEELSKVMESTNYKF